MGLDGSGGRGKFAFLGLFYLYKFEHLWYNGVNKLEVIFPAYGMCIRFIGKVVENVINEAVLSNNKEFTSFMFHGHNIRFKTSPRLERYTKVVEWDHGYIVVMAKYEGCDEEEEYIDLIPILNNLYIDVEEFLKPIQKVRIEYV